MTTPHTIQSNEVNVGSMSTHSCPKLTNDQNLKMIMLLGSEKRTNAKMDLLVPFHWTSSQAHGQASTESYGMPSSI